MKFLHLRARIDLIQVIGAGGTESKAGYLATKHRISKTNIYMKQAFQPVFRVMLVSYFKCKKPRPQRQGFLHKGTDMRDNNTKYIRIGGKLVATLRDGRVLDIRRH